MKQYAVAVDQSTSATKAFLVDARGQILRRDSRPHRQSYPAPGWAEHDAAEIWTNTLDGIRAVIGDIPHAQIACLSLTNQRETTVLWDRATGEPVCPAIVWQDVRAEGLCAELMTHAESVHRTTGLYLSPYYSAAKAAHALRHQSLPDDLCVGTVDSYLLYRLSGGQVFATDVSNASRTQLLDLQTLRWDDRLIELFGLRRDMLADQILPSDAIFCEWEGIPVCGVLGDSHAALFGHGCHAAGQAKATYGTGSSVMMNTGDTIRLSDRGLSASVGFGFRGRVCYALEGNVTHACDTLVWLRDGLGLVSSLDELEALAQTVPDAGGVSLIPAFSGLGAPYFDASTRAILTGMNRGTSKAHVARAGLDAVAHQNADVIEAMGVPVTALHVDGGGTKNALMMQAQADLTGCEIRVAAASELSALGCAVMGGLTTGLYADFADVMPTAGAIYRPVMDETERKIRRDVWRKAVGQARYKGE